MTMNVELIQWEAAFGQHLLAASSSFIVGWKLFFFLSKSLFSLFWVDSLSPAKSFWHHLYPLYALPWCEDFFFLLLFCFIKIQGYKHAEYLARGHILTRRSVYCCCNEEHLSAWIRNGPSVSLSTHLTWISKFLLWHLCRYLGPVIITLSLVSSSINERSHTILQGAVRFNKMMSAIMLCILWSALHTVAISIEEQKNPNLTMNYSLCFLFLFISVNRGYTSRERIEWMERKILGTYCGNRSSWEITLAFSAPCQVGPLKC